MSERVKPFRIYIENARDDQLGGFTMPLPAPREALQPFLDGLEIRGPEDVSIIDIRSPIKGIGEALSSCADEGLPLDDLNYLAAKLQALDAERLDKFCAVCLAEWYTGDVTEIINITENLDRFELQPAFSAAQYGEFLIDSAQEESAELFERLEKSQDFSEKAFAQYIQRLENSVDRADYGRKAAKQEGGVFTDIGYLVERGAFQEIYRGPEDIPAGYRVFSDADAPAIVKDVELMPFLMKLYAVTDTPTKNLRHDLETLSGFRSTEYLLQLNQQGSFLTEAAHVYRNGSAAFEPWMGTDAAQAFSVQVTNIHGELRGDVVPLDTSSHRQSILDNQIFPVSADKTRHFAPEDLQAVHHKLEGIRDKCETNV